AVNLMVNKVWEELKETYDKVYGSIIFGLHHQIHILKQNGSFITDYYHKLNALWKQFDAMIKLPRCVCNASECFKKHNQLMKLMQILMGLDDSYMQIRSSILSREILPDVKSTYATISSEESHRVASSSIAGSSQRNQASASMSNMPNRGVVQRSQSSNTSSRPNDSNANRQGGGSGLVCENYGFNGHTIDRCFKIIGYPTDFGKNKSNQSSKEKSISNNNSASSSSSSGFIDEQMATLISLIKYKKGGKNVHVNMAGFESGKYSRDWLGHPAEHILNVLKGSLQFDNKDQDDFVIDKNDSNVSQDFNHETFFDLEYPELPNDDERVDPNLNSDHRSQGHSSSSSEFGNGVNTTDFPEHNSGNDADSSYNIVATQNEGVVTLEENVFAKGNIDSNPFSSVQGVQPVRRSTRQSVFPKNYNDFVVESKVKYGLEKYVGYLKINSKIFCFVTQLNKTREPKTYFEASKYSHWIDAMNQEMDALLRNARLVAQGFGQKEGIDYEETFSPVVKMVTVRCLLNIVVSMSWPVFQLDVNNAFLYGDLKEVIFMKPPEGYFPSDNKSDKGVFLALLVYVDDIIFTGNSIYDIEKFKVFLKSKFMIKDLGNIKYFLGIEVVYTDKGICLNQRN
ncbi:ribonuclease H-like domain-containing protein, partial [Tanacetum coccineum]